MDPSRRGALRGRPAAPHVVRAICGSGVASPGAQGWKTLLTTDLAPAAFCPACWLPELRRRMAGHRAGRSLALAGSPAWPAGREAPMAEARTVGLTQDGDG